MTTTTLNLEQFTGTEYYYKHLLGILYTDGVKYLDSHVIRQRI